MHGGASNQFPPSEDLFGYIAWIFVITMQPTLQPIWADTNRLVVLQQNGYLVADNTGKNWRLF